MKFTCLIPVYNTRAHHLIECVNSIINQTLPPNEILIIDDGSTSKETIDALELIEFNTKCQILKLPENGGTSVALNYGHLNAKHDWIAVMGSDDIAFPNRFEMQMNYIKRNPKIHVLGTGLFAFYDDDPMRRPIFRKSHPEHITEMHGKWVCNHGTAIYNRSILIKVNGYDTKLRRGQDVDFWYRIFNAGFIIRNIPDILYAYRRYNNTNQKS